MDNQQQKPTPDTITREAIERLRRIQQIMEDRQGKPFSENSTDMLKKVRKESTRELMAEE